METGGLHEWRYIRAKERLINEETVSRPTPCKSLTNHSLQYHCTLYFTTTKMKQTLVLSTLAFLASCVAASPTPTVQNDAVVDPRSIEKRAAITDAADVGYATQNGGYVHTTASYLLHGSL